MVCVLAIDACRELKKTPLYRRLHSRHGHEISAFSACEPQLRRALLERVWQTRPEVIMWSGYTNPIVCGAMAQLAPVPIPWVLHAETSDHLLRSSHWKGLARDLCLRALYTRTSALAFIGQRSQRHFQRLGVPPRKQFFAPFPMDTDLFEPDEADRTRLRRSCRSELQVPERRALLLSVGELSQHKDPARIVYALRSLPTLLRMRITLAFLGGGELAPELAQLAAAEPRVDVRWIGDKTHAERSAYYHAADALVLSSRCAEAWGAVVHEALHHGTPCIVSHQVGCAPDLIVPGQTGEIFEAGNTESLVRAMERIWPRLGTRDCRDQARAQSASFGLDAAVSGVAAAIDYAVRGRTFAFR
ncbi:MAG TPA: glycosyltransferase family 4 protein [Polyangiales bacterium]|nr:glycosyltransferase family 4 protein [Polyangiales bacterium]